MGEGGGGGGVAVNLGVTVLLALERADLERPRQACAITACSECAR